MEQTTESNPFADEPTNSSTSEDKPVVEETVVEESSEEIVGDNKEMVVGELSDKPKANNHKLTMASNFPDEEMVLEIKNAYNTKPFNNDVAVQRQDGKGSFYKKKLAIQFDMIVEGGQLIEYYPSVYYGTEDLQPTIPKACKDEDLENAFTPMTAKIRNKFLKAFASEYSANQSDADFVKALIGKKAKVQKKIFKGNNGNYVTLMILDFVTE